MTPFNQLCTELHVTPEEREAIVQHLALLRYHKTLEMVQAPPRPAPASPSERPKLRPNFFPQSPLESIGL